MVGISNRIGDKTEDPLRALDWIYRQLTPSTRLWLSLITTNPNLQIEGGCWLPAISKLDPELPQPVGSLEAMVSGYIRGECAHIWSKRVADITIYKRFSPNYIKEMDDNLKITNEYSTGTLLNDATGYKQLFARIGNEETPIKTFISSCVIPGKYLLLVVGQIIDTDKYYCLLLSKLPFTTKKVSTITYWHKIGICQIESHRLEGLQPHHEIILLA